MVVTGALEHVADRVTHLVYLDAFVPRDGEALNDLTGAHAGFATVGPGAQWLVPSIARAIAGTAERVLGRRRPLPARPRLALPRDRHRPHDPYQAPRRTRRPVAGTGSAAGTGLSETHLTVAATCSIRRHFSIE